MHSRGRLLWLQQSLYSLCLLGVGAALFDFFLWLGRLRNRSYVDARQLQQFFERLYLYGSLLTSSSLIHALGLPARLAWSFQPYQSPFHSTYFVPLAQLELRRLTTHLIHYIWYTSYEWLTYLIPSQTYHVSCEAISSFFYAILFPWSILNHSSGWWAGTWNSFQWTTTHTRKIAWGWCLQRCGLLVY